MGSTAVREQIIATAASRQGILYSMPCDGENTLDCSMFVLVTLRDAGVGLPAWARSAEQIRQACERIELDEAESGDLLFFEHTYDPGVPPGPDGHLATHVGITLGRGNRQMWDCHSSSGDSGPPGVGITQINEYYWEPKLFEARRPPGLLGDVGGGDAGGGSSGDGERGGGDAGQASDGGALFRVTTSGVRLRAAPSTSATILVADLGASAKLVSVDDQKVSADGHTWRHVRAPGGQVGWVADDYLEAVQLNKYVVGEDGLRLRATPDLAGQILTTLARGTVVTGAHGDVAQVDGRTWRHVIVYGSIGWVAAEYLSQAAG
jgi:SH3-like domain-containing protein